jgi:hypothetical protein
MQVKSKLYKNKLKKIIPFDRKGYEMNGHVTLTSSENSPKSKTNTPTGKTVLIEN